MSFQDSGSRRGWRDVDWEEHFQSPNPSYDGWKALGALVVCLALFVVAHHYSKPAPRNPAPTASISTPARSMAQPSFSFVPHGSPQPSVDPCLALNTSKSDRTDGNRIVGGGLSAQPPEGGNSGEPVSALLVDVNTRTFSDGNTFLEVGRLPKASDVAAAAKQIVDCHVTPSRFPGMVSNLPLVSTSVTVDGRPAHWVRTHARNSRIASGGVTFDVVAVNTGRANGPAIYFSGLVDGQSLFATKLDSTRESLIVATN